MPANRTKLLKKFKKNLLTRYVDNITSKQKLSPKDFLANIREDLPEKGKTNETGLGAVDIVNTINEVFPKRIHNGSVVITPPIISTGKAKHVLTAPEPLKEEYDWDVLSKYSKAELDEYATNLGFPLNQSMTKANMLADFKEQVANK